MKISKIESKKYRIYKPKIIRKTSKIKQEGVFFLLFHLFQQSSDNTQESRRNLCAEQCQRRWFQTNKWGTPVKLNG